MFSPTQRYAFFRQFCNWTPAPSSMSAVTSSSERVVATAFRGDGSESAAFALHVANLGAARQATVEGIPANIRRLRAIRTTDTERNRELPPIPVRHGRARLALEPHSLLTLVSD